MTRDKDQTRRARIAAAAAIVVCLSALVSIPAERAGGIELRLGSQPIDVADLDGAWRSRGYGWLLEVKDGRLKEYEESGSLCLKSLQRSPDHDGDYREPELSSDKQSFTVLMADDQFRYTFDRIDALPESCSARHPTDPVSIFDAVVETLNVHYAFFDTRKIDWTAAVARERAGITAKTRDLELFKAISRLLSNFRDSHVSIVGEIGDDELEYYPSYDLKLRAKPRLGSPALATAANETLGYWNPMAAIELLGETAESAADDNFAYGLIDGDIGYLAIRSMSGYSQSEADRVLKQAEKLFDGTSALIIDVSLNDGGYDMTAKRIAGHFARERTLAYSKYAGDSSTAVEPQPNYLEPNGDNYFSGPVYVLTSETTVSAAEIFVMAMRALPNVEQIGEPTDGSLSDILSKPLPNGWSLNLSNEIYLDSNGAAWEGKGIPPQVSFDVRQNARASEADLAAARRVVDRIRSLAPEMRPTGATQSPS